jgi:hypothetical protein
MLNVISNGIMIALALNTAVIFISIIRDGYCLCVERKWIAWLELVLMVTVIGFGIWRVI